MQWQLQRLDWESFVLEAEVGADEKGREGGGMSTDSSVYTKLYSKPNTQNLSWYYAIFVALKKPLNHCPIHLPSLKL